MDEDVPTMAADLLAGAQQRSGLTLSAWSAKAGVSRALLHNYLRGRHQPSLPQLDRLLRAAGQRLHIEARPAAEWIDPGQQDRRHLGRGERRPDREAQGRALLDVLSVADAIPVRRRTELRYPRLRDLMAH